MTALRTITSFISLSYSLKQNSKLLTTSHLMEETSLIFSFQYWMCPSTTAKYIMQRILNTPKSRNKAGSGCKRQSEDSVSFVMDVCRIIPHVCTICIKIIKFSKPISKALCHEHCILPTYVKYFCC